MKEKTRQLLKQALSFFCISGIGWLFDFFTYVMLTKFLNCNVMYANMISAIPAFTYVFSMSNKRIFKNPKSLLSLKYKYIIYFVYQILLVISISILGEILYKMFLDIIEISFILEHLKIVIKLFITPITMTLNFIIMKNLIEKL